MAGPNVAIRMEVVGLRELRGKFEELAGGGLRAIELSLARKWGGEIRDIYREAAPRSATAWGTPGNRSPFWRTIGYQSSEAGAVAFEITIQTTNGKLRTWLKEGTGIFGPRGAPIVPTTAGALSFDWRGRHWVLKSVKGMKPNPWEDEAYAEALPLAQAMNAEIAQMVLAALTADEGV